MRLNVSNSMKLSSMAILLVAVGAMMIPAMPFAMAMPDPTTGGNPDPSIQNSILNIEVSSSPLSEIDELIVYDSPTSPTDDDVCSLDTSTGTKAWRLVSSGDGTTPIRMAIPAGALTGLVTAPFGTGVAASFSVQATGGAMLTADGSTPTASGITTVSATWLDVGDVAGTPSTDRVGNYRVGSCGNEGVNLGSPFEGFGLFSIVLPIGGMVIPVGATSLVLAGISTNALSIVSLVAIAGVSFAVLKFQVSRKED